MSCHPLVRSLLVCAGELLTLSRFFVFCFFVFSVFVSCAPYELCGSLVLLGVCHHKFPCDFSFLLSEVRQLPFCLSAGR
eukprot:m.156123 g.156123  ORF g.156123 m.156123 type:complete len:79 (-) comp14313_c0_seq4:1131-1367(-)